ncbi:hypothetical protein MBLNU459_g0945t1 [Dothideomycetes sp. NU459]
MPEPPVPRHFVVVTDEIIGIGMQRFPRKGTLNVLMNRDLRVAGRYMAQLLVDSNREVLLQTPAEPTQKQALEHLLKLVKTVTNGPVHD